MLQEKNYDQAKQDIESRGFKKQDWKFGFSTDVYKLDNETYLIQEDEKYCRYMISESK